MKSLVILLGISMVGCTHFFQRSADMEVSDSDRAVQVQRLSMAEEALSKGQFEVSLGAYRKFQIDFPQSIFVQSARLGEAESLEGQGRYQEATDLNREIYLKTLRYQPEIAAQALYRSGFCYEALGDDVKAVAGFLDAYKLKAHLPAEVAEAEIPAKLASIYARQSREKEARDYLNEAERGLAKVRQQKGAQLGTSWLARTYFQMGSVSTNQLTAESFGSFAQGQLWVQSYLIKAMKLEDPVWSSRAQQKLIETYRDLFNIFEASRGDLRVQVQMGGDLFDLMDQAELFKPLSGEKIAGLEAAFFRVLEDIRRRSGEILYTTRETMGLTVESQRLNGLRRPGRVKADSFLPGELKRPAPLPPKIVPSEDPNL